MQERLILLEFLDLNQVSMLITNYIAQISKLNKNDSKKDF